MEPIMKLIEAREIYYIGALFLILSLLGLLLKIRKSSLSEKKSTRPDISGLKPKEQLDFFFSTMKFKFEFWYEREIMPYYIVGKYNYLTDKDIKRISDNYVGDVIGSLHPGVLRTLLSKYYSGSESLKLVVYEHFMLQLSSKQKEIIRDRGVSVTDIEKMYGIVKEERGE